MGQCIYYKLKRASLNNVPSQAPPQGLSKSLKCMMRIHAHAQYTHHKKLFE